MQNDLVKTSYVTQAGDSGGIVYAPSGNTHAVAGITCAGSSTYSIYTKSHNINSALGLNMR